MKVVKYNDSQCECQCSSFIVNCRLTISWKTKCNYTKNCLNVVVFKNNHTGQCGPMFGVVEVQIYAYFQPLLPILYQLYQ